MPRVIKKARPAFPKILTVLMIPALPIALLICFLWIGIPVNNPIRAGVTFSQPYAESLGLDSQQTLISLLDDLKIRHFRLPAYWKLIEARRGSYDWSALDAQMDAIAARGGKVVLAIGARVPRWPECWAPDWVGQLSTEEAHDVQLKYMQLVVERYRNHPALERWQVENELLFQFGVCPPASVDFFKQEVALVRTLDPTRSIATTDSGELSTWMTVGPLVDRLGVSVYRVVRQPSGFIWAYSWIPPYWYAHRALLVRPWIKDVYVSEFQMEPWVQVGMTESSLADMAETFDPSRMRRNFDYAERMGIKDVYFWGAEWWLWMKTHHGDARFWEEARTFFHAHAP
jgi:hypothetical protein